jgi:hypothetical protein
MACITARVLRECRGIGSVVIQAEVFGLILAVAQKHGLTVEKSLVCWREESTRTVVTDTADIFERNYLEYQAQLSKVDLASIKDKLGILSDSDKMFIPFLNKRYYVSNDGITDESGHRPDYSVSVILFKYILLCPAESYYDEEWTAFRDFKRISHFTNVNYFSSDTEKLIEKNFSGKLNELRKACDELGGFHHETGTAYDLSMQFIALPRVSLLLLFNDGDEEFPAKCTVLFQKHAEYYLDPECLAMTSAFLAKNLKQQILP